MKVLVCDKVDAVAVERIRSAGHEVIEGNALKGADLIAALVGVQGLLVRGATKVTADVFPGASTLQVVVRAGTGLDNIDQVAAEAHGVQVRNTPNANSVSVAELVFAMLLAIERHLLPASNDLKRGVWEKSKYQGRELSGRTFGLLGFGRIGREVATRARAFDMTVLEHDPRHRSGGEGFDWVKHVGREELVRASDVLSLHVPLEDDTRGSIGAREFAMMKKDAVLINASRGGVVDEAALLSALTSGGLRAAAVDVFMQEPAPAGHPLLALPNVLPLPHLGASTAEAQRRAGLEAADILLECLAATAK
ncbi:MAG: hydroxyacid dehydrogenase [Candidatus Eisenbacteria bacterium]